MFNDTPIRGPLDRPDASETRPNAPCGHGGRRRLRILLASAAAVVLLSGCTRGTQGIFATIEVEERTETRNLVDNTSVTALVAADFDDPTDNAADRLVVLAGTKIFSREVTGTDWSEVSAPDGRSPRFLGGIDTDDDGDHDEVYAAFSNIAVDRYYLYRLTESGDALTWTNQDAVGVWQASDGYEITGMRGAANRLLMSVTRNPSADDQATKDRVLWSFGSALSDRQDLGEFRDALNDVAHDGTNTVIMGRGGLMVRSGDLTTSISAITPAVRNARGVGAFDDPVTSGTSFAVSTAKGTVYISTDGGASWEQADGTLSDRSLADIAWVAHRNIFVVGSYTDTNEDTTRRGYWEATLSTVGGDYSFSFENDLGDSYDGSELAISAINSFRYFTGPGLNDTLFALTNGKGLWRIDYAAQGNPGLTWE